MAEVANSAPPEKARKHRREKEKGKAKATATSTTLPADLPQTADTFAPALPPWSWALLADSDSAPCAPVFTRDAKYFFVAVASSVKIYSVATTRVISTLHVQSSSGQTWGSKATITALLVSPQNPYQLITASADGRIRIWDFLDAVLLRTIDCGAPIAHMTAHGSLKDFVFVATKKPNRANSALYRVSIASNATDDQASRIQLFKHVNLSGHPVAGLALSPAGQDLVVISGPVVFIVKASEPSTSLCREYNSPRPLTCLAFHPTEQVFATGDTDGVIRLWYCLDPRSASKPVNSDKRRNKAPTTVMHWHAHPVASLAFTPNGAYLLSGGEEAVLVVWQLQSKHKEFVPRLGAPIDFITVVPQVTTTASLAGDSTAAEQGYLVSLTDGGMSLIDSSSLRVSRTFVELKRSSPSSHVSPPTKPLAGTSSLPSSSQTPLAIHPLHPNPILLLPSSHPTSLQAFSPTSLSLLTELEIAPSSNRISARDPGLQLPQVRVTHCCVSSSAEWMATVDWRDTIDGFGGECVLRVWRWMPGGGSGKGAGNWGWVLNTRVERPHERERVLSLAFSPNVLEVENGTEGFVLLSAGLNGVVRTWTARVVHGDNDKEDDVFWSPRASLTYRSQQPSQAIWSPDSSLIAVAHGPSITLWDPLSSTLLTSLTCADVPSITTIAFLSSIPRPSPSTSSSSSTDASRYIASYSGTDIVLWDIISQSIIFTHRIKLSSPILLSHPHNGTFALIGTDPEIQQTLAHPKKSKNDSRPIPTSAVVAVFGPTSAVPLKRFLLPFGVKQAIWYPASSSASNQDKATAQDDDTPPYTQTYSLLALTTDASAVLIGDDVNPLLPTRTGSTGRGISAAASAIGDERPTLFQDIFGRSAFETPDASSSSAKMDIEIPELELAQGQKSLDISLLDGPAHLLPPITSLFDELISGFVGSSSASTSVAKAEGKASRREDELMDVDDVDVGGVQKNAARTRSHKARTINEEEMTIVTELFRSVLSAAPLAPAPASSPNKPTSNGHGHVNGKLNGHANGTPNGKLPRPSPSAVSTTSSSTPKPRKHTASSITTPTVNGTSSKSTPSTTTPSPAVGQKRKKAST